MPRQTAGVAGTSSTLPCFQARRQHTCSIPALAVAFRSIAAANEEGTLASWKLTPFLFPA